MLQKKQSLKRMPQNDFAFKKKKAQSQKHVVVCKDKQEVID